MSNLSTLAIIKELYSLRKRALQLPAVDSLILPLYRWVKYLAKSYTEHSPGFLGAWVTSHLHNHLGSMCFFPSLLVLVIDSESWVSRLLLGFLLKQWFPHLIIIFAPNLKNYTLKNIDSRPHLWRFWFSRPAYPAPSGIISLSNSRPENHCGKNASYISTCIQVTQALVKMQILIQ